MGFYTEALKNTRGWIRRKSGMKNNKKNVLSKMLFALAVLFLSLQSAWAVPGIQMLNEDTDFATSKYQLETVDLEVKVLGGVVKHRRFLDGAIWQFNPNWTNLQLEYDADAPEYPSVIKRNRYAYEKSGAQTTPTYVFNERLSIVKTTSGYRWDDRNNNWIDYDEFGYATSFGNEKGVTAYLIRNTEGLLQTVEDRNHVTVLTFNYDANRVLDNVEDHSGRIVDYSFTTSPTGTIPKTNFRGAVLNARLDSVVDVRGKTWNYGYNADENTLRSMTDPNGNVRNIHYKETLKSNGAQTNPYVCVDWAGGSWGQGGTGSWSFGGHSCLSKVQQGGSSSGGSASPDDPDAPEPDPQYAAVPRLLNGLSDDLGTITSYQYQYNSRKKEYTTAITDGDKSFTAFTYDEKGELVNKVRNGRVVETQKKIGSTRELYDENGNKTVIQEDKFRNPIKYSYADNSVSTLSWDIQRSQLLKHTDENGNITQLGYTDGLLTALQRGVGSAEQQDYSFAYNAGNELSTITEPEVNGQAGITRLEYDAYGNVTKIIDSELHEFQLLDHDALGNPRTVIDARDQTTRYTYDDVGNLLTVTTPLGFVTEYGYDDYGNLVTIKDPELKTTTLGYDIRNRLSNITDHNSHVTRLTYNGRGLITGLIDPLKHGIRIEYNLDGQIEKIIDGNNNEIAADYGYLNLKKFKGLVNDIQYPTFSQSYSYDQRNRPTLMTEEADGVETRTTGYSYYNNGNLKSITHPDQLSSRFAYDALNRLTDFTDAANQLTTLNYDDRDRLTQVTNAKQHPLRRYGYDQIGNLKTETFADDAGYSFDYDGNGNLVRQTDAKGQVTAFVYDIDNRLQTLRYFTDAAAAQDVANAQKTVHFTHDKKDRLKTWDDGTYTGSFNYDDIGRLLNWSTDYGSFTQSGSYSYYANGLKKTYTGPDNLTISYGYDNNNQLQTLSIPGQGTVAVNEYQWYAPKSITLPGGGKRQIEHDGYMRTGTISNTDSTDNTQLDYHYQYDDKDNISSIDIRTGQTTGETRYSYDELDRLYNFVGPTTSSAIDLAYDQVGNRTSDSRETDSWVYDSRDRLTSRNELTYGYDDNGSLTSITHNADGLQKTFHYNLENRLEEVKDSSNQTVAQYQYDPFGRRISKTTATATTYFFYAPEGLVAETDTTGTITTNYGYRPDNTSNNAANNTTTAQDDFTKPASGQLTQAEINESSRWGTDPVYIKQNNQVGYYQNDHLGTPKQIVTASGVTLWSADYDAFGDATIGQQTITNNLRFPGQYYDQETGLHYNYFRYYDPNIGRYIRPDPTGLASGLNTYSYVYNNPLYWTDPYGLWANVVVGGGIRLIGGRAVATGVGNTIRRHLPGAAGAIVACLAIGYCSESGDDSSENESTGSNSCPIPDTTPGRKTKGRTKQFEKPGNFDTANDDFDDLNPTDVVDLPGGGRRGTLPDGRSVNVRPNSSDGRPTIEIQNGKNKVKVRYY